ncbi:MAG: hypothetical protein FVQ82_16930 [Planctomycetes bacterium]|nr:hypothetical protein [Planctomycetota bacterium]
MAIEAPLSKYKKQNYWIFIAVLVGLSAWCIYDGYFSEKFIEENTSKNEAGEEIQGEWLIVNRYAPYITIPGAILMAIRFFMVKDKKIVAGATSLQMGKVEIPYDSIERITKTFFDKKGYFTVTYKDGEKETDLKLSSRNYDNMQAILDELVKQIS